MSKAILTKALAEGSERLDGWVNYLTGLGSSGDKSKSSSFQPAGNVQDTELEGLFHENDLAQTVVVALPQEALRQGFDVKRAQDESQPDGSVADVQAQAKVLDDKLEALGVAKAVEESAIWGRLYGASAILLGVSGSGEADEPLDLDRVQDVEFLKVFDRRELRVASYVTDPNSARFGEPEIYAIQPLSSAGGPSLGGAMVHASRLILFPGAMTAKSERGKNGGFDDSVLRLPYATLLSVGGIWDSVCAMVPDSSQGVFKVKGLLDAITSGFAEVMQKRMRIVDQMRGITNSLVLDADSEDFKNVERASLVGVGDLLDRAFVRLAAAVRMPVTILMGQSPAGLNATGATDLRWWYDTVQKYQEQVLEVRIKAIVRVVSAGLFPSLDPALWDVEFPSLWQPTPVEQADVRGKVAATDVAYINAGVLLPEEVALSRFGGGSWSSDYVVDLESRKDALASEAMGLDSVVDPVPSGSMDPTAAPIADTALNGAQVTGLLEVVARVGAGGLDLDAGVVVLRKAFPTITDSEARTILKGANPPPAPVVNGQA